MDVLSWVRLRKKNKLRKVVTTDEIKIDTAYDGPAYKALMEGLKRIKEEGVDRVVLAADDCEPNKNATGRWSSFNESDYYPFEILSPREQEMIKKGKHYVVAALVNNDVGGIVKYPKEGVEVYQRTHVAPLLPRLKPESNLNYITQGGVHTKEMIRAYAREVSDEWTAGMIEKRIEDGIKEYNAKTMELMEKAGVYKTLDEMNQREHSPFEKILYDMRKNINAAKNK